MPRPKKSNRSDGRYEIKRVIGYDADENPIRKSFYGKNKDEALASYQEYLADEKRREEAKKRTDFASWVNEWLYTYKEPNVKHNTFSSTYRRPCENQILPHFQGRILQDITHAELQRFMNGLSHLSQSRMNMVRLCLCGIFETAIDNDLIQRNPCRNLTCKSKQEKKIKRTYDRETVDALCASNHKYSLYVHILLRMGLRCSELCGLRWEDIDLDSRTVKIVQALTVEGGVISIDKPKSANSMRRIEIPEDLLARIQAERGDNTGYIAMLNGHHVTPEHFTERTLEAFYNHMKVPQDQRLTTHELRHTCGTLMYEETKDIYHVSRYLGHSDINITTKIYVHSEMQEEKIHIDFGK